MVIAIVVDGLSFACSVMVPFEVGSDIIACRSVLVVDCLAIGQAKGVCTSK